MLPHEKDEPEILCAVMPKECAGGKPDIIGLPPKS